MESASPYTSENVFESLKNQFNNLAKLGPVMTKSETIIWRGLASDILKSFVVVYFDGHYSDSLIGAVAHQLGQCVEHLKHIHENIYPGFLQPEANDHFNLMQIASYYKTNSILLYPNGTFIDSTSNANKNFVFLSRDEKRNRFGSVIKFNVEESSAKPSK